MEGAVSGVGKALSIRELAASITELAGHLLEQLPRVSAAMARGELSYSEVRELTRVATPGTEQYLLMIGLHGTASHVEQLVRQYRRVQEAEALSREDRQQARHCVSYCFDDEDGSLVLQARLPAEAGMLLLKALEAALPGLRLPPEDCEPRIDVPAGTSTLQRSHAPGIPPTARRADALAVVAAGSSTASRCAARSTHAIGAACSPAARTSATSMATTRSTGPRAAPPGSPTSSRCAAFITARCTKAA